MPSAVCPAVASVVSPLTPCRVSLQRRSAPSVVSAHTRPSSVSQSVCQRRLSVPSPSSSHLSEPSLGSSHPSESSFSSSHPSELSLSSSHPSELSPSSSQPSEPSGSHVPPSSSHPSEPLPAQVICPSRPWVPIGSSHLSKSPAGDTCDSVHDSRSTAHKTNR